jgi:molecular chaperone DnaK (HSP70)
MKQYIVGIDLGTSNTVVAYAEAGSDDIRLFEIEQLIAPGQIMPAALLPSLRYHPAPGELAAGDLQLPWMRQLSPPGPEQVVIGALARKLGAQVPGRLVASAKSWLSHPNVDRLAPILPWGSAADVGKVSPVAASASYLAYVRAAWNWRFPHHPLEQQQIVLTVPASFDEGARALTVTAANQAGLPHLRLLEEPQAALYDWLYRHRHSLAAELAQARLILVCDVGGGTTDLSLIRVAMENGQPQFERIGVGQHLMLGGDNMDLVLAHVVESRMGATATEQSAARLSASRLSQLMEQCRSAKEQLLAAGAPGRTVVTLLGSGSRMIGGTRSVELMREEVERLIVDGFFPMVAPTERVKSRRSGIVEFGLPYASDPAITRHLANFLTQHASAIRQALAGLPGIAAEQPAVPDALLLNGGVFRAAALVKRLQDILGSWRGMPLRLLQNDNPNVAVARGAVAFALAQQGRAPKIGGGSARSYFLILEDDPASRRKGRVREAGRENTQDGPGTRQRAICIFPRGIEQGQEIRLEDRTFALRLGHPVRFHLASSTAEAGGKLPPRLGQLVTLDDNDYVRLPALTTVLKADAAGAPREIPVQLVTSLTEIGTLELHCVSTADRERRWLLEFQLRGAGSAPDDSEKGAQSDGVTRRFAEAVEKIDRIFGTRAQRVTTKEVRQLRAQLEQVIGRREDWDMPLLRQLFDVLWQRMRARRRSADHERVWLNLTGYCLRPGFGYPLDDWRIEQLWPLFEQGVQYGKDSQVCSEWWTLWRRIAGGLDQPAQLRLLDDFAFNVQEDKAELARRPVTLVRGSYDDMLRLAASLEKIPGNYKTEIGAWLLERLQKSASSIAEKPAGVDDRIFWAIGRIGARQPFYGGAHDVVSPEVAAEWLESILALDWRRIEPAAFAAAHLARMTGDRSRDLPDELRSRILRRLSAIDAPPTWIAMVREIVQLDEGTERRIFGESLPPGLKLIG